MLKCLEYQCMGCGYSEVFNSMEDYIPEDCPSCNVPIFWQCNKEYLLKPSGIATLSKKEEPSVFSEGSKLVTENDALLLSLGNVSTDKVTLQYNKERNVYSIYQDGELYKETENNRNAFYFYLELVEWLKDKEE